MKHTVLGYSQRRALALEPVSIGFKETRKTLDYMDLICLKVFTDFYPIFPKRKIIDGVLYVEIDYKLIQKEIPILTIKESEFFRAILRLCNFNVLVRYMERETASEKKSYYALSFNYDFITNDDKEFIERKLPENLPVKKRSDASITFEKYNFSLEDFIKYWNEKTDFVNIKYMNEERCKNLALRLKECIDKEEFVFILRRAALSNTLTGKNELKFVADIDFFLRKSKFLKIREGFYDNRAKKGNFTRLVAKDEDVENLSW